MTDKETRELLEEYGRELRSENPDIVRQRFKQRVSVRTCPTCGAGLVNGLCQWCDHGCRNGCGPVSLKDDAFCQVCGTVTFRCPGDGCKSKVHVGDGAE